MNTVTDEVLNTAATDNKIKYRITKSDNSYEIVEISLETPVTTQGTPLNRALFESIKNDLNNRLLKSSKASAADVQAATNADKYATPASLTGYIVKQNAEFNNSSRTDTIYTFDNNMIGKLSIFGFIKGKTTYDSNNYPTPKVNYGACIVTVNDEEIFNSIKEADEGFKIEVDFDAKAIHYIGDYTTITRSGSAPYTYSAQTTHKDIVKKFASLDTLKIAGSNYRINDSYNIVIRRDF